jgi:beta-lactamase class D
MDTSGGIDLFWLDGGMRVTPEQQLDFLQRLHRNSLPFSKRSIEIVKKIMIEEETPSYTLRTKTGWAEEGDTSIGWYVGYITKGNDAYFFATCIQTAKPDSAFPTRRKSITRRILANLEILK